MAYLVLVFLSVLACLLACCGVRFTTADAGDGVGARRVRLPRVPSSNPAGGFHKAVLGGVGAVVPGFPHLRLRGDGADEAVGAVGVSSTGTHLKKKRPTLTPRSVSQNSSRSS